MFFEFSLAFGSGKKRDHEPPEEPEFRDASGGQHEIAHSQLGFQPNSDE